MQTTPVWWGYSMGGYGLVNNLGGGYSDDVAASYTAPPNRLLAEHTTGNPKFRSNLDPRIKAGFAIAPWGMTNGVWRQQDLAGIQTPTFYLAGDKDTVSGYENGVRAIYEGAINSDRYLLTYKNAAIRWRSISGASRDTRQPDSGGCRSLHGSGWDTVRMNNVMGHFATAYFNYYLKGDVSMLLFQMSIRMGQRQCMR